MTGSRIRAAAFVLCAVIGIGLVYFAPRLRAQIPGSLPSPAVQQPELMPTLLDEVKAIRADLVEAVRINTAAQLLLGRVQLQQLQLGRLDQRLAIASARRIEAAKERATTAAHLKELARQSLEELSADQRQGVEAARRRLDAQLLELQAFETARGREEADLTRVLTVEQDRLEELLSRLDALERKLSRQP